MEIELGIRIQYQQLSEETKVNDPSSVKDKEVAASTQCIQMTLCFPMF